LDFEVGLKVNVSPKWCAGGESTIKYTIKSSGVPMIEEVEVTFANKIVFRFRPSYVANAVIVDIERKDVLAPKSGQQLHYKRCCHIGPFPTVSLYKCKQIQAAIS